MNPQTTRFAPSPTGRLHLGHAYSALVAWNSARDSGGSFLLRIEDIDSSRCRPHFIEGIYEDLAWLGLSWEQPVRLQSEHPAESRGALRRLGEQGLLYPCFCTRKDILREIESAGAAPHGPEGLVYPGTCRFLPDENRRERLQADHPHALRLDLERALRITGPLQWEELGQGLVTADFSQLGDVVLARKDIGTSYHLALTLDDAIQEVTLVTRGEDLFHATAIHRLLQELLGLPAPRYHHHRLLRDEHGKRFSKRDPSLTLQTLREAGETPAAIRECCRPSD